MVPGTSSNAIFKVLEIEPTKDLKLLKSAYRKASLKYHPDVTKDNGEKFREVKNAYDYIIKNLKNINIVSKSEIPVKPKEVKIPFLVYKTWTKLVARTLVENDTLFGQIELPEKYLNGNCKVFVDCSIPFSLYIPFQQFSNKFVFKIKEQEIELQIKLIKDIDLIW